MKWWSVSLFVAWIGGVSVVALGQGIGLQGAAGLRALQDRANAFRATDLLLFGGENNDVFLGCLSCNEIQRESVFNPIGPFGSSISATSIKNKIGQYGSPIATYSPCNPLSTHPPVVVDTEGHFYGELTVNTIRPRRFRQGRLNGWLAGMCEAN